MVRVDRQEKIVLAAQELLLRQGLRGASMEAIAREAGIAKPTLYSYFKDKDAVFAAVVTMVVDDLVQLVSAEMEQPGTARERVGRALAAKLKAIFRLLEGSPHAEELYGEKRSAGGVRLAQFETWFEGEIVVALEADGVADARRQAQLLLACAEGILRHARHASELGPAIRHVVNKLLA